MKLLGAPPGPPKSKNTTLSVQNLRSNIDGLNTTTKA
jgi:hypothetical protein